MLKFDMIVDDNFCRLNERMIVHVFRPAGFVKNRLKSFSNRKWLPSEEEESHNSDYSDAKSEKVKKPKKSTKLAHEKWNAS